MQIFGSIARDLASRGRECIRFTRSTKKSILNFLKEIPEGEVIKGLDRGFIYKDTQDFNLTTTELKILEKHGLKKTQRHSYQRKANGTVCRQKLDDEAIGKMLNCSLTLS